ncbi:flagellar L-ring protein precursor FlgH [Actimicrobium sp. GrIS 1.19]|uniref:flagellar basal body L-ring protein FlgH n=1 Tax=Actimicrobium sp. GrIS 1.19 TaxID=3071708 RepID=UPI002E03A1ED|nr:flagellar L-ring protein precursor FlgH [Actimicrobium sp. GrIS 1.19]
MHVTLRVVCVGLLLAALGGCAVTPTTIVQQPATTPAPRAAAAPPSSGAIFQSAAYRPLFEDRRARMVGDILSISISEKTTASKAAAASSSKTGSATLSVPKFFGVPAATTADLAVTASGGNKFEDKGAGSSNNSFVGTIGVTVVDVLPNGYLVVSGEKQVGFDRGTEFIRLSGVVNPDNIVAGNTVASTQVADARIEYRTNTHIDKAEMMSLLTRFFLSVIPL